MTENMTSHPKSVPLKEYQRKSVIPPVVGAVTVVVAILIMGIAAFWCFGFSLFNMLYEEFELDNWIEQYEQRILYPSQETTDPAPPTNPSSQEGQERDILGEKPNHPVSSVIDSFLIKNLHWILPSLIGFSALGLLLGFILFLTSIALAFRFRRSRTLFIGICVGCIGWIIFMTLAFLLVLNEVITIWLVFIELPGSTQIFPGEFFQILSETYKTNLIFFELFGGILGLSYFSLMIYLVTRPQVKVDIDQKPPKDRMDWDQLETGERFGGDRDDSFRNGILSQSSGYLVYLLFDPLHLWKFLVDFICVFFESIKCSDAKFSGRVGH